MDKLTISEICDFTKGNLVLENNNSSISYISTDSRTVHDDALFIAIIGERLDGHDYLENAYLNGYRSFVIDNNHNFIKDDINLIKVENTTKALGSIAKGYKEKFDIPFICVTGSVGKTSTKDIIYSVLKEKYNTLKNEGNLNNEIGLPKTILNLNKNHEVSILEMGMSFKGEIKHLVDIVHPDIAVISNIGMSHIENFESQDDIFDAKMEITSNFNKDSILIVNGDDKYLSKLRDKALDYKLFTYGFNDNNDIVCSSYEVIDDKIKFTCLYKDETLSYTIPSPAKHNILNCMASILVGKLLNIDNELIKKGLESFSITKGRLTVIKKKNLIIIDDSYNASTDSMISALNVLKLYKNRKIAVLGDILETGTYNEQLHRMVGKNVINNCDILITVGNSSLYIKDEAIKCGFNESNIFSFKTSEELIKEISSIIEKDDVILFKASNGINLGKVVSFLEEKYED